MQFGVRSAPVSRPAPVAPGPSDPSPAPTMVGATKLIATHPSDDEVES
jgi:hypothetical protein